MHPKVLFAIDEFPGLTGGTENQFWHLIHGLRRHKIPVGILLLKRSEFLDEHLSGIPINVLDISRMASLRSMAKALSAAVSARKDGYSLVHTFMNDASILLPWAMRISGLRVIISRRDEGYWHTKLTRIATRINRVFVSRVVTNSHAVARSVAEDEKYSMQRVKVIRNGIDRSTQFPSASDARARLGIGEGDLVFSVLANLRPLKRIDDVLRAFSQVRSMTEQNLLLVIAGEDQKGRDLASHQEELEELARELGITDTVRFLGYVTEVEDVIAASDIGVLSSETEGLSNSVIQYMLGEKPMIASRVGGNLELVEDEITGLLVEVGDVDHLAELMKCLASQPDTRLRYGERARARIMGSFGVSRMLEQHITLYSEVCQ